jgi:DNA-binding NarL/FixJ family response regulator
LRLLIAGKSNKEIGRDLNLQEVTVKVHLRNIYRKIKATSRTDAVRIALQKGWN